MWVYVYTGVFVGANIVEIVDIICLASKKNRIP